MSASNRCPPPAPAHLIRAACSAVCCVLKIFSFNAADFPLILHNSSEVVIANEGQTTDLDSLVGDEGGDASFNDSSDAEEGEEGTEEGEVLSDTS